MVIFSPITNHYYVNFRRRYIISLYRNLVQKIIMLQTRRPGVCVRWLVASRRTPQRINWHNKVFSSKTSRDPLSTNIMGISSPISVLYKTIAVSHLQNFPQNPMFVSNQNLLCEIWIEDRNEKSTGFQHIGMAKLSSTKESYRKSCGYLSIPIISFSMSIFKPYKYDSKLEL